MIRTVKDVFDLFKIKKYKSLDDVNGHSFRVSVVSFKHILNKIHHINLVPLLISLNKLIISSVFVITFKRKKFHQCFK